MSERRKIEERLRKKEQEIQSLEEKLKAARVYVQALRDVMAIISKEDETTSPEAVLRTGSTVAQARDVILQRGEPVHVNELLEALGKEVTRETRSSLTSSIAAYVRRGEIFTRPAPNTFGLVELEGIAEPVEPEDPPEGFGGGYGAGPPNAPMPSDLDEEIPF